MKGCNTSSGLSRCRRTWPAVLPAALAGWMSACGGDKGAPAPLDGNADGGATEAGAPGTETSSEDAVLEFGKINIEGDVIERHAIRRLEAGREKMRDCYVAALAKRPGMKGRIVFTVALDADGTVARADVAGARFPDASVGRCMSKELAKLQFPASPGAKTSTLMVPVLLSPTATAAPPSSETAPAEPAAESTAGTQPAAE